MISHYSISHCSRIIGPGSFKFHNLRDIKKVQGRKHNVLADNYLITFNHLSYMSVYISNSVKDHKQILNRILEILNSTF